MKAALRQTLDGTSYRAAGSECGVDFRDLHKNAKRLGLDRAHLEAWRDYWGPAIAPAWKHHLRRLDNDLDVAGDLDLANDRVIVRRFVFKEV